MKPILTFFIGMMLSASVFTQTRGFISKDTKEFFLRADMRQDHQIFGYARPDVKSAKLILLSIFTSDVKGNKYKCPLGAYYDTNGLPQGDHIYFVANKGLFSQMKYVAASGKETTFYFKKKFIDFSF